MAAPTAPQATTSGPTLPATEPNRQPQPPHRPAQQRRGSHALPGRFISRLIPGLIVIASVIGNTHFKQAQVRRVALHQGVGSPRVGTPPALSSDAAIRPQARWPQEIRTLPLAAQHEIFINLYAMKWNVSCAMSKCGKTDAMKGGFTKKMWGHYLQPPWEGGCREFSTFLCIPMDPGVNVYVCICVYPYACSMYNVHKYRMCKM